MSSGVPVRIVLRDFIAALEEDCDFVYWYLDRETGEVFAQSEHRLSEGQGSDSEDRENVRFMPVEPIGPQLGIQIIKRFLESVDNRAAARDLASALSGKEPFRSFRAAVSQYPELREIWHEHYGREMRRIAEEWLKQKQIRYEFITLKYDGA